MRNPIGHIRSVFSSKRPRKVKKKERRKRTRKSVPIRRINKSQPRFSKDKHNEIIGFIADLNKKQKEAVLCKEKRILVLAGAGAGKTKTIIQKILYLIAVRNVNPSEILAITFTKNAANEMIDRLIIWSDKDGSYKRMLEDKKIPNIEKDTKRYEYIRKYPWLSNITVRTFHSTCYNMLRKAGSTEFDNKFKIISDPVYDEDDALIKNSSPETANEILHKLIIKRAENPDFLLDLKRYILDFYIEYERRKKHDLGLPGYEKPYVTLKGDKVRSKSERYIADWLYRHNIDYIYEPETLIKDFEFHPDFYVPDADVYIEHVSNISYSMKDKEEQFKIGGKTLIKTYEPMVRDISEFHQALERMLVPHLDRDLNRVNALMVEEEFKGYWDLLNRFITDQILAVIDKAKVVGEKNFDQICEEASTDQHERVRMFYLLAKPLFHDYEEYCTNKSYLDFNDLLLKAVSLLKNNAQVADFYRNKFRYILVDEFQDVNSLQVKFLKCIMTPDTQLFCVGDDWQSIYGWRGSEVEYIVDFQKHFENPRLIKLDINYRSNNTIVSASNEVIKHNKFKIDKDIRSLNMSGKKIYLYCAKHADDDGVDVVLSKIKQFYDNGYKKEDVLILYRRSATAYPYRQKAKSMGLKLNGKTIHSAKGLEAKVVFILGLVGGTYGFPNVWDQDRIFQYIKKSNFERQMEEERRLFYVALTRAKDELFLISEIGNESSFIKEIPGQFLDRSNFLILDIKKNGELQNCGECGKELDIAFLYCPYCGLKIVREIKETEPPVNLLPAPILEVAQPKVEDQLTEQELVVLLCLEELESREVVPGKPLLASTLQGTRSPAVIANLTDKIMQFGKFKGMGFGEIMKIIDGLIINDYIDMTENVPGKSWLLLGLTEKGKVALHTKE